MPFRFKVPVDDESLDGNKLEVDLLSQLKKQGLDLAYAGKFMILDNSDYGYCASYPSKIVIPAKVS